MARRPAPRHIALRAVGSSDAPDVRRITRKLFRQIETELAMGARGDDRILEVINARWFRFTTPAKVNPGVRVLVDEKRRVVAQVFVFAISNPFAFPSPPRFRLDGRGRRADGQQIKHHLLAVVLPAMFDETVLRSPSVREQMRMPVQHPLKINPLVNLRRQPNDLSVAAE